MKELPWSLRYVEAEKIPIKCPKPLDWAPWKTHQEYIKHTSVAVLNIMKGMRCK